MLQMIRKDKSCKIWLIVTCVMLVLTLTVNLVCTQVGIISGTLNNVFGYSQVKSSGDGDFTYYATSSADDQYKYYQAGHGINSKADALAAADAFTQTVTGEGFVLLKNEQAGDNLALPLKSGEGVTVLGKNSVNLVYGSSGSCGSDRSGAKSIYDSLDAAGIAYNTVIKAFYEDNKQSGNGRDDNPSMESGISTGIQTGETPVASYTQEVLDSFGTFSTALVVFSRIGGEGFDLPRSMWADESNRIAVEGAASGMDHYLELDQNEQDLLNLACSRFDKVVVLINSATAMELGFLDSIEDNDDTQGYELADKIQAAIWIGCPGNTGIMSLGKLLTGEINPSGKLIDTYARDFSQSPTWQNFSTNLSNNRRADGGTGNAYHVNGKLSGYYYVEYEEGIYLGYRYYETRALTEGEDWYTSEVVYPFGYGLSYTNFQWELVDTQPTGSLNTAEDIAVQVRVTNTGSVAGKDVVQVYYTAPYITGEIEKSDVVLAGFAKTELLQPGESQVVTVSFPAQDMASYDYNDANGNGFKGYEMDMGDYVISVCRNAHEVAADGSGNKLIITRTLAAGETFPTSAETGNAVENQFDDVSQGMTTVLSRADWKGTFPKAPSYDERNVSKDYINSLKTIITDDGVLSSTDPNAKTDAGLMLYDMIGLDKDDPQWDTFMAQLSLNDMAYLIGTACYSTANLGSIDKPLTMDLDGPVGFVNFMGDASVYDVCGYASECLLAATWNTDLAYEYGISVGNESLIGNEAGDGKTYSGWYAPGVNIHRSPFGGRNSEYFSEDPTISGLMAANVVKGATAMGVYTQMKHFALNEQETNRSSNGILTWADEQTIREIYLKGFQIAVEDGGSMGMMSSFNRIGTTWAGGSKALLTNVLRDEWGFNGMVICDFNTGAAYMNVNQMIQAGGDINLAQDIRPTTDASSLSQTQKAAIQTSAKNMLYVIANSNAMNGFGNGITHSYVLPIWEIVMFSIDGGIALILILWGVAVFTRKACKKAVKEN